MKRTLFAFLIFVMLLASLPANIIYGNSLDIEYLDVRLTRPLVQKNLINMESSSGFSVYDKNNKDTVLSTIDETTMIATIDQMGDISLLNSQNNLILTLPRDGSILIRSNTLDNPTIKIEKDRYRDYIRLVSNGNEIIVINHVNLENYLYGVVPREMPSTFHPEALKAQAVASRSFALSNINKHSAEGFGLCDTTHCQVYSGFDGEKPSTNLVVDETRNIFAYYNGKVIEAIFHSTSSGITEDSANVWGGDLPYLKSVEDNFSAESPHSNWSFNINVSELSNKLITYGVNIGDLQGIEVLNTTLTGKVEKVKLIGTAREEIINATQFRNIVGNTTFKSTWFSVKSGNMNTLSNKVYVMDGILLAPKAVDISKAYILDGKNQKTVSRSSVNRAIGKDRVESLGKIYPVSTSEIIIEGKGFGHGVGMSQYGAKKMAELGYSFEEILKHYYTGIDIM